jgi:hypothetical protein
MAKLSPLQRQALDQIANPGSPSEAQPLFLLGTIKALMKWGLIKREPGLVHDQLVATPAGRTAVDDGLRSPET